MSDEPIKNDRLLTMEERSYTTALLVGDNGMWTIFETIKRPIAQAPSRLAAEALIRRLEKSP